MNLFPLHENMIPKLKREDDRFRQSKKNNMVWLNKFQELVEYKEKYGDCKVNYITIEECIINTKIKK